MAYTRPTFEKFAGMFPAFSCIDEARYTDWVERAERTVTDCFGDDQDFATMLLTAHYLVTAGFGTGAEAEMAAQGMGGFTSIKSGSLSLERAKGDGGMFSGSTYGRQFLPYLRAAKAGPRVTGTGCAPGYPGFNGFAGPLPNWQG